MLVGLQHHLVQAQTEDHCWRRRRCQRCGTPRPIKDKRSRRLASLFGTVTVSAPRFEPCRCAVTCPQTLSPALVHFHGLKDNDRVSSAFPWAPMPHKHNAARRHHIPKMAFKVENWPEYEAGLRRRDSLTLWIEDGALEHWQTLGPGGQARYADVAIQTTLMVRTAFKLALRQTEGLLASVITLMDLRISVPDHTTISRRAVTLPVIQANSVPHGPLHLLIDSTGLQVYGAGQWLEAKHGAKSRRKWRKLHLAVDAGSGMIVAQALVQIN